MYGMNRHIPQRNYFADIVSPEGSSWAHVRTNLGRKVAYAILAKHYEGAQIKNFRDEQSATQYDRDALAQGSDGLLRRNPMAGYGEMRVYF